MRNVQLPPVEALPLRCGIVMMVVVPSFTERDYCDEEIISAIIYGCETASAEDMREGINRESAVIEEHRADKKSPDQHLPPGRA